MELASSLGRTVFGGMFASLFLCFSGAAAQTFTTYTDRTAWANDATGTILTENFNAATEGNFSDPYVSSGYSGFCLSGGTTGDTIGIQGGGFGGNIDGSRHLGWTGASNGPTINFNLASQATAFGFAYSDTDPTDIWNIKILGQTYQNPPFSSGTAGTGVEMKQPWNTLSVNVNVVSAGRGRPCL